MKFLPNPAPREAEKSALSWAERKEVRGVEIKATPEEIAALVAALQERRISNNTYVPMWPRVKKAMDEHPELFTSEAGRIQDASPRFS